MICAGCVRKKNIQNTLLKNLLDACCSSIAFFAVGYAFAFGSTSDKTITSKTFVGTSHFFLVGVENLSVWFFQYVFSATAGMSLYIVLKQLISFVIYHLTPTCRDNIYAVTIIAGTLAERCQMLAYLYYSILLSGWVYPVIVHAIWSHRGFLSAFATNPLLGVGVVDFAGSGVVHLTGGTTALFAAIILGPRRGRFTDETGRNLDVPKEFPGSSFSLQVRNLTNEFYMYQYMSMLYYDEPLC